MELLFLSHCVPNPPSKGEKIRAYYELEALCARHTVHVACFAREEREMEEARALVGRCASVYVAPLFPYPLHLARAGARFAIGRSLNTSFYSSEPMKADIAQLMASRQIGGAVAYTSVMAEFVPAGLPYVLDLVDVDSEKWRQYARERFPGFLYGLEAGRIRRDEQRVGTKAEMTFLTTAAEEALYRSFAPEARTGVVENGVDFEYFDAAKTKSSPELAGRDYLLFVGTLDYYPNYSAVEWFAREVFPALRAKEPQLELLVVGRNAPAKLFEICRLPGVELVGTVEDVRPYYRHARAMVAPLEIARGIQNKVLEALAMDVPVLASEAVGRTFGRELPRGVTVCATKDDYARPVERRGSRKDARGRFQWASNLKVLTQAVERLAKR